MQMMLSNTFSCSISQNSFFHKSVKELFILHSLVLALYMSEFVGSVVLFGLLSKVLSMRKEGPLVCLPHTPQLVT